MHRTCYSCVIFSNIIAGLSFPPSNRAPSDIESLKLESQKAFLATGTSLSFAFSALKSNVIYVHVYSKEQRKRDPCDTRYTA